MNADSRASRSRDLTMAYGGRVVMRDLSFQVRRGEIFVIMGGSGSGKSTLLKHLIGLKKPAEGTILFDGEDFGAADEAARKADAPPHGRALSERGALERADAGRERGAPHRGVHRRCAPEAIAEVVSLKLALVGLRGFESFYPVEISGGMRKRAALARADGAGSGGALLRRALVRPGPDHRQPPRRPDPAAARQLRHHHRGREPRPGQHLQDRRPGAVPGHRAEDDDGARAVPPTCGRIRPARKCTGS